MGVSWSKEEELKEGGPLDKDTLLHIFGYLESLDELVPVASVNRYWASLLGSNVVPKRLASLQLRAWYAADSIKSFKASSRGGGVEACSAWHASPKGGAHLLSAFPFPQTLRSRVPDSAPPLIGPWSAAAAKGGEPRVVKSRAGKKAVQFVDVAGRHPVHLRTNLFEKPLPQPVTIICVGIAFEDATYVSGINDRFEVCHSYPNAGEEARAPVSMTAHPVGDSSDSDDDPSPACIVSGTTQPGEWHVYTAVFNGEKSELYVDGRREGCPLESAAHAAGRGGGGLGGGGAVGQTHANVGVGSLDGLTIGADHRNDFPLGSMVEGTIPGVLSELVVFGSVLPAADRLRVERKLMQDHNIAVPSNKRDRDRRCAVQAQQMIAERAPGRRHPQIPLRYLARHVDVSWHLEHPVTGDKIRPKRIGVRETDVSSGWDD